MQVKALQKQFRDLSLSMENSPKSAKDALSMLEMCCKRAGEGLEVGYNPSVQVFVEQALAYLMFTYHYLNLDLEQVAERELSRWQGESASSQDRVILVFSDHAELRVDGELRGTIPVYEQADHSELKQIAHLFSCRLEYADHIQLNLFARMQAAAKAASE